MSGKKQRNSCIHRFKVGGNVEVGNRIGQIHVDDFFTIELLKDASRTFVAGELKRFKRVKANLTAADDPKTKELSKQYAIVGVPTIVFLDSNGNELRDLRLTGFEEPEKFLERAKRAR